MLTTLFAVQAMCFQVRDALRVGCIGLSRQFFCNTMEPKEVLKILDDEMRNFCILVEAPKTPFGRGALSFELHTPFHNTRTHMEEWKQVERFSGLEVSSLGRIRAHDPVHGMRCYKPSQNPCGYRNFSHSGHNNLSVAREVALAFLGPPPDGYTVDHIDRDRGNNTVANLRWATKSQQCINQKRERPAEGHLKPDDNQTNLPGEQWKIIKGVMVSNMGRARVRAGRSKVYGLKFTPKPSKTTYSAVVSSFQFHRLVATAFHGPPPSASHTVDHRNRNTFDNRAANLRWATRSTQSKNRTIVKRGSGLCKAVLVRLPNTYEWIRFNSRSEAARYLTKKYKQDFSSGGITLAARRSGIYHKVSFKEVN
jgi:hypothetical protein